jgi:hypothetical protein
MDPAMSTDLGNRDIPASELRAGDMLRTGVSAGYVLLCDVRQEGGEVCTVIHGYSQACRPWTFRDPSRIVRVGRRGISVPSHKPEDA